MALTVHIDPDPAVLAPIAEGLRRFDESRVGEQRRTTIAVIATADTGVTLGGVHGSVLWGWAFVDRLWVSEDARGHGLGGRMLTGFEAEAHAHGARTVALFSASWQAPEFYAARGYRTVASFDLAVAADDGPATNHLLVRELGAPAPGR